MMPLQGIKNIIRQGVCLGVSGKRVFYHTRKGPLYFMTRKGPLSVEAAHENFVKIARAHIIQDIQQTDWKIDDAHINWENHNLKCVHTHEQIEAVYAEIVND